jgi:Flp pilus assembly protein TadG
MASRASGPPRRDKAALAVAQGIHRLRVYMQRCWRDCRGVAALEFGLLAPLFIVLLCAILENGLILFTQTVLDNATRDASRQILLGTATTSSFSTALCNGASSMIPCSSIKYNVKSGSTFAGLSAAIQTDSAGNMTNTQFTPGTAGQDVLIQVAYNRPYFIPFYGLFSGVNSELLVSTIAMKTEPY